MKFAEQKIPVALPENYDTTAGPIVNKDWNFPNQGDTSIDGQNKKRDSVFKKTRPETPGFKNPSISLGRLPPDLNKSDSKIFPIVQRSIKSIRKKSVICSTPIEFAKKTNPDPLGLSQCNSNKILNIQPGSFDLDSPD